MIHCRIHFLFELDSLRRYLRGQNLLKICRVLSQKSGPAFLDAEESLGKIGRLPVGKRVALRLDVLPKFKSFVRRSWPAQPPY